MLRDDGFGGNVIRFPVEFRAKPSIGALVDIEPDVREMMLVAEAFGLDGPYLEGREKADHTLAATIAEADLPADPEDA